MMKVERLNIHRPMSIEPMTLGMRLQAVDEEFKGYLHTLTFKKSLVLGDKLHTYSPLDAVMDFELRGISRVAEVDREGMMGNEMGMKKLLANMLAACQPGALSEEDVAQLSGINGRELTSRL